ncbi:MAG: PrsW family intramembrane metalloprotease [SAR202 cluster bacterium]|nr:PrsW family intramembrane metalloprotease [SAR202 cluster bacterium]
MAEAGAAAAPGGGAPPPATGDPSGTMPSWAWLFVAVSGAVLGVGGAFIQETLRADVFMPFIAGPMIEEAMKPVGLYVLLARRPASFGSRSRVAVMGALAGMAFGLVESVVYVLIYYSALAGAPAPPDYVAFRFTVPVAMHAAATFIFSMGITPRLRASVTGQVPFLSGSWRWFVPAVALHSLYNVAVAVIESFSDAFSFGG